MTKEDRERERKNRREFREEKWWRKEEKIERQRAKYARKGSELGGL